MSSNEVYAHNNTTMVYCKFQVEGMHHWPDCNIPEVEYLKYPHRHIFHFKLSFPVTSHNRELEFIMLKHKVVHYIKQMWWNEELQLHQFGAMSCEMIATDLLESFPACAIAEVSEDDENGAIITRGNIIQ